MTEHTHTLMYYGPYNVWKTGFKHRRNKNNFEDRNFNGFFFFFLYTLLGHFLFKDPNLDQYLPDFSVLRHHLDGLEM